jgi:hypothetical protein
MDLEGGREAHGSVKNQSESIRCVLMVHSNRGKGEIDMERLDPI